MGLTAEIILILILIIGNGMFAMSEIAVVSARRARLQRLAQKGNPGAAAALSLANDPNQFLSTVQVGITLVSTLAGALGGATIAEELAVLLQPLPVIGPHKDIVAFGIVVAAISYFSLILGELVPKRIALNAPERIASMSAPPMRFLSRIASPAVKFLSFSTDLVLKILPLRRGSEPAVTEEEVRTMIALGTQSGVFHKEEREMVEGVFRLGDRRAVDLMTPRSKVVSIDLDKPLQEALETVRANPYSRYPAVKGGLDRIVGVIETQTLAGFDQRTGRLADVVRKAIFIPEGFPALRLIELFRSSRSTIAIVVGEHGEAMGIVTSTDLLQAIVGGLPLSHTQIEPRVVQRQDGSWLIDGLVSIHEVKELLNIEELGDAEESYNTLGGFIMHGIGRIPATGDSFQHSGFTFEVVDMDGHRVDRVLITSSAPNTAAEEASA